MKFNYLILSIAFISGACSGKVESENSLKFDIPFGMKTMVYAGADSYEYAYQKSENTITAEGDLKNGVQHGSWMSYDQNGAPVAMQTYNEGLLQGASLRFDNQGYVETKAYYHAGNLQGEYLVFKRKKIVERRNYQGGVLSGLLTKYYDNGNLMQEVPYVENQIDGIGKWYDQEGNMTIAYRYEKGVLVDENPSVDE